MKKILLFILLFGVQTTLGQTLPEYVPADSLESWYSFDGDAIDALGVNNGVVNGATLTADKDGNLNSAYQFDGIDDYIDLSQPYFGGSDSVTEFSFSFWVRVDEIATGVSPYDRDAIISFDSYWRFKSFRIFDDGSVDYVGANPEPQTYFGSGRSNSGLVQLNEWNHFVTTFKDSLLEVYRNGELVQSGLADRNALNYSKVIAGNSTGSNLIGAARSVSEGYYNFLDGVVDDYGVWNRKLSLSEIQNLYRESLFAGDLSSATISVDTVTTIGSSSTTVPIKLNLSELTPDITSFELDITTNRGMIIDSVRTAGSTIGGLLEQNTVDSLSQVSFAGSNPLSGSDLILEVDISAPAAGDYEIFVENVLLDTTLTSTSDTSLVAYTPMLGDTDNNGQIQAYDASTALKYSVGKNSFSEDPFPWNMWRFIAADVNSDGQVVANDASQILRFTVGLIDIFNSAASKGKSSPSIDITVQNSTIVFTTSDTGLYGLNISLPNSSVITYGTPKANWENSIIEYNDTENLLRVALASTNEGNGNLLELPIQSDEDQVIMVEYISNTMSGTVEVDLSKVSTSTEENESVQDFELNQNYPNPFNPTTTISYSLPQASEVKIEVYNALGSKVAELVNEYQSNGRYTVNFDASKYSSGLYFYKITTSDFTSTKKMMLIK